MLLAACLMLGLVAAEPDVPMTSPAAPIIRALSANEAGAADSNPQHELFSLINSARTKAGLPALRWDDRIANAAMDHARIMAAEGRLSHQYDHEPDLLSRLSAQNMRFDSASENVVYDATAAGAHEAFMGSAKHQANILNPAYNSVGVAALNVGGILYVVEDFTHEVSEVQNDEAALQIASRLAQMRERAGARNVPFVGDVRVQQVAERMAEKEAPDSSMSLALPNARFAGSYATRDLSELPASIARLSAVNGVSSYSVGVHFARTPKYPAGLFWVTIVLFDEARTLSRNQ